MNIDSKFVLDESLSYIVEVIIGEGHITNSTKSKYDLSKDYRISIELSELSYMYTVFKLFLTKI